MLRHACFHAEVGKIRAVQISMVGRIRAMMERIPHYGGRNTNVPFSDLNAIVVLDYLSYYVFGMSFLHPSASYFAAVEDALARKMVKTSALADAVRDGYVPVVHRVSGETGDPGVHYAVVMELPLP